MMISKKEKFFTFNSLLCLVHALQDKVTTIDLRNENSVTGKIQTVDGYMNIFLDNVIFRNASNEEFYYEMFHVQARNIRYIHIPDNIKIVPAINEQVQKMLRKKLPTQIESSKVKRAKQRHQETLNELKKAKLL